MVFYTEHGSYIELPSMYTQLISFTWLVYFLCYAGKKITCCPYWPPDKKKSGHAITPQVREGMKNHQNCSNYSNPARDMFTILLRYGLSISITHVMIVLDDKQIVFTFSLIFWQWDGTCSWNCYSQETTTHLYQYDVMTWKHFPGYWPFVRGIHRSPVNSPHKGQWRGALMSSLICARTNGWVNNREAGDLRSNRGHYDVTVMTWRKVPG